MALLDHSKEFKEFAKWLENVTLSSLPNLKPLLPALLNLRGEPFSLDGHFPFEPLFNLRMPRTTVFRCGRQLGKSTGLSSQGVVQSNCIPYFNTLYVTPLFEMVRRFSDNYVRPFIDESPVKGLWTNASVKNNVLQRGFINGSSLHFSYTFRGVDRTRGLPIDKLAADEYQDIDPAALPIMQETMSASPWSLTQLTGTPKTLDGPLDIAWLGSSQAEWVIDCHACHYENIPALAYDLDEMIGPWHEDISEARPGVICAKCKVPIFPRTGRWVHADPGKKHDSAGYHLPQFVMPMHYASPDKWRILLGKRQGMGNTPLNVFYNEVCGEGYDIGAKLVTITELKQAATLNDNTIEAASRGLGKYIHRVLAVDWGGGGGDGANACLSFTTAAVLGMTTAGKIECIFGWRSLTPHDQVNEAVQVLSIFKTFQCSHIIHDYTGAGENRAAIMSQMGFPAQRFCHCVYVAPTKHPQLVMFVGATDFHPRDVYRIEKARSLILTCTLIKLGLLKFFKYDYKGADNSGLLHDFLALMENKIDGRRGGDIYTVIRNTRLTDDFAQAVNIGCMMLFHMSKAWPDLATAAGLQKNFVDMPAAPQWEDWED